MENKPNRIPLPSVPADSPPGASHAPAHNPPTPSPFQTESGGTPAPVEELRERIVEALGTCYDPEIPVNIYELGLIYGIDVQETGDVAIRMTLTSPMCPVAGSLPPEVQAKVQSVPGVKAAKVDLVWDPPWNPDRMSEAARVQLGMF